MTGQGLVPPHAGAFHHWLSEAHPEFADSAAESSTNELCEMVESGYKFKPEGRLCGIRTGRIKLEDFDSRVSKGACKVLIGRQPYCPAFNEYTARWAGLTQGETNWDVDRVRDFVRAGGYLILNGPELVSVEKLFPGTIKALPCLTLDKLVDAELVEPDPVLSANLVTNALWHVPHSHPLIKVVDKNAVRVLCKSRKLATESAPGEGVLAAVFAYGNGYVLCLVGTLNNNCGYLLLGSVAQNWLFNNMLDAAPKLHIALRQGLAANFIEAGLTKTKIPEGHSSF
jgi:hypothetical protein